MNLQEAPCSPSAPIVTALQMRLPTFNSATAHATRVGFDPRFPFWLSKNFGPTVASISDFPAPVECLSLDFACTHGDLTATLDAEPWPALRLAALHPDADYTTKVATILLKSALTTGSSYFPELRLVAIRLTTAPSTPPPAFVIDGIPIAITGMNAALSKAITSLLASSQSTQENAFSSLRVPTRLHLFKRTLPWSRLSVLGAGDVILSGITRQGRGRWPVSLFFGSNNAMQTEASIDINSGAKAVHVDAPARPADAHASVEPQHQVAPSTIDNFQVPVAFEIDSTLLSIAEISALAAGAIIELDVALANARVRLLSHGQLIGSGQLVAVGDQLGVRIVNIGLRQPASQGVSS